MHIIIPVVHYPITYETLLSLMSHPSWRLIERPHQLSFRSHHQYQEALEVHSSCYTIGMLVPSSLALSYELI